MEVFFFEAGKAKWEPLTCTFSSREEIRMIDVIFQETASEKNTWSENVTYYPFFFFFLKCELVLKIAHIHFDFRVKHCELWQNGGRKCWGQILACCRKKIYIIQHPEVFPQHQTAWVIYTYCTAAGVPWQSLSTCRHRNEIQDVSPSTMNPS